MFAPEAIATKVLPVHCVSHAYLYIIYVYVIVYYIKCMYLLKRVIIITDYDAKSV